jgi:hypothetical protein
MQADPHGMPWLRKGASYAADILTAAAASLGLIPIAREIFLGADDLTR